MVVYAGGFKERCKDAEQLIMLLVLFLIVYWLLGLPLSMRRRDSQKTMSMVK